MDWLQFISSVTGSIAWPVVLVVLVKLMREPLTDLLKKVSSVEWGDKKVTIAQQLQQVSEAVEATTPAPQKPQTIELIGLEDVARIDPRTAIMTAWITVEREVVNIAINAGISRGGSFSDFLHRLLEHHLISDTSLTNLLALRRIRDSAVHAMGRELSEADALQMAETCARVLAELKGQ